MSRNIHYYSRPTGDEVAEYDKEPRMQPYTHHRSYDNLPARVSNSAAGADNDASMSLMTNYGGRGSMGELAANTNATKRMSWATILYSNEGMGKNAPEPSTLIRREKKNKGRGFQKPVEIVDDFPDGIKRPDSLISDSIGMPESTLMYDSSGPNPTSDNELLGYRPPKKTSFSNLSDRQRKHARRKRTVMCLFCILALLLICAIVGVLVWQFVFAGTTYRYTLKGAGNTESHFAVTLWKSKGRVRFLMTAEEFASVETYADFPSRLMLYRDRTNYYQYCFIRTLNESSFHSMSQLEQAAINAQNTLHIQPSGQNWRWRSQIVPTDQRSRYVDAFPECEYRYIFFIQPGSNARRDKCHECQHVCVPSYGVFDDQQNAYRLNRAVVAATGIDCFWIPQNDRRPSTRWEGQGTDYDYDDSNTGPWAAWSP